jgi:hypothetical protein
VASIVKMVSLPDPPFLCPPMRLLSPAGFPHPRVVIRAR